MGRRAESQVFEPSPAVCQGLHCREAGSRSQSQAVSMGAPRGMWASYLLGHTPCCTVCLLRKHLPEAPLGRSFLPPALKDSPAVEGEVVGGCGFIQGPVRSLSPRAPSFVSPRTAKPLHTPLDFRVSHGFRRLPLCARETFSLLRVVSKLLCLPA